MSDRTGASRSTGTTPSSTMSPADIAAHRAASHVRPLPVRPGLTGLSPRGVAALDRATETVAYWLAERADAEQVHFELAAGGLR